MGVSIVVLLLLILCHIGVVYPRELPDGFVDNAIVTGVERAIDFAFLPDGRILVASKQCRVHIALATSVTHAAKPYLNINNFDPFCHSASERGLLGIAIDPEFDIHPYVYIYVMFKQRPFQRVERYQHVEDPNSRTSYANISSRTIIWGDDEGVKECCHYGGGLTFGLGSYLYIGTGDKTNVSSAQDQYSSAGKIHCVDREGVPCKGNIGLIDGQGGHVDTIWASGLRNAFRLSFDSATTKVLVASVGGNNHDISWESVYEHDVSSDKAEILNFGWPLCEGYCGATEAYSATCQCNGGIHQNPTYSYQHGGHQACIVGGFVYRPAVTKSLPADFTNSYIYGDYSKRTIEYVRFSDSKAPRESTILQEGHRVVSVKEGPLV